MTSRNAVVLPKLLGASPTAVVHHRYAVNIRHGGLDRTPQRGADKTRLRGADRTRLCGEDYDKALVLFARFHAVTALVILAERLCVGGICPGCEVRPLMTPEVRNYSCNLIDENFCPEWEDLWQQRRCHQ